MACSSRGTKTMAATAAIVLMSQGSAVAEVCDKVRPDWSPGDGPVTIWWELHDIFFLPGVPLMVAAVVLGLALNRRWMVWPAAFLGAVLAILSILYADGGHEVWQFAIREGCVHPQFEAVRLIFFGLIAISGLVPFIMKKVRTS